MSDYTKADDLVIIDKKELKKRVPYSLQHIARMEKAGTFPGRVRLGPNRVGWRLGDVLGWIRKLKPAD